MRNARGQVKIRGSEKIGANMNTGNKILVSAYDNSSIKVTIFKLPYLFD